MQPPVAAAHVGRRVGGLERGAPQRRSGPLARELPDRSRGAAMTQMLGRRVRRDGRVREDLG